MSWPQSANPNPLRQRRLRAMKAVILPTFAMSQLHHCFMRPPPSNGSSFIERETEAQRGILCTLGHRVAEGVPRALLPWP